MSNRTKVSRRRISSSTLGFCGVLAKLLSRDCVTSRAFASLDALDRRLV